MNTPRSKKPTRFEGKRGKIPTKHLYAQGLFDRPDFLHLLGMMASLWPHVEDSMIQILEDLMHDKKKIAARQVFRSIINQRTRIQLMRTLLEKNRFNKDKSDYYDRTIDEFDALNKRRNTYLHGLWWVQDSPEKTVWFAESALQDATIITETREVKITELQEVVERMAALNSSHHRRNQTPSPDRPPQPPDDKSQ